MNGKHYAFADLIQNLSLPLSLLSGAYVGKDRCLPRISALSYLWVPTKTCAGRQKATKISSAHGASPALPENFTVGPPETLEKPVNFELLFPTTSFTDRQPLTDLNNSRRRQNGCYVCESFLNARIWADARSRCFADCRGPLAGKSCSRGDIDSQLDLSRASPSIA